MQAAVLTECTVAIGGRQPVRWRKAKTAPAASGAVDLEDRGAVVLKRTIEVSIIRTAASGAAAIIAS
jgi:hypothetical protein